MKTLLNLAAGVTFFGSASPQQQEAAGSASPQQQEAAAGSVSPQQHEAAAGSVSPQQHEAAAIGSAFVSVCLPNRLTTTPPKMPAAKAATGRKTAIGRPIRAKVTKMLSMPVCGVEIKKEVTAPLEAPLFFSSIAVGTTPQEQSGRGTPTAAALMTELKLLSPSWRKISSFFT